MMHNNSISKLTVIIRWNDPCTSVKCTERSFVLLGVRGAGRWETGCNGGGIPKGARAGRKRKILQHCAIFCKRKLKHTEVGTTVEGDGTRSARYGK